MYFHKWIEYLSEDGNLLPQNHEYAKNFQFLRLYRTLPYMLATHIYQAAKNRSKVQLIARSQWMIEKQKHKLWGVSIIRKMRIPFHSQSHGAQAFDYQGFFPLITCNSTVINGKIGAWHNIPKPFPERIAPK